MKRHYYFILKNSEKDGPYLYEDLIKKPLFGDDDIWRSDMGKWQKVYELEEFENVYLASPPPTPNEINKQEKIVRIEYFKKIILKKSIFFYFIICFIITLTRFAFAIYNYERGKGYISRYGEYRPSIDINTIESMYGNQEAFLFRALRPQTIYLSTDEQESYGLFFWNLYMSNIVTLFLLYILIIAYLYNYVMKVKISYA